MQTSTINDATLPAIVAEAIKRVKLSASDVFMVSSFSEGRKLDNENRYGADQEHVNHAAFVKKNRQDKPDYEEYCRDKPKFHAYLPFVPTNRTSAI